MKNIYIIGAILITIIIGVVYGVKTQTDEVELLILPENQTKFVDETAEYNVYIKIARTIFAVECRYDGKLFMVGRDKEHEEKKTYTVMSFGKAITRNFSHNLYCFYIDSAGQRNVWNITKSASVRFIGYPINFSVQISNGTRIDCEKPEGVVKGKLMNRGGEGLSCYYTKIYEDKKIYESKETFSIPSPIPSYKLSEFYINVSLDDIPKKINITCWNAHDEVKNIVVDVPLSVDLTTRKKIDECESDIKILKEIANRENIIIDFTEVEKKLSDARKYELRRGCIVAERYATECITLLKNINETIIKKKAEKEKEQKQITLKANASACIERLRTKILNLTSLPYGNKTAIFVNSASEMLKSAEKNFVDGKYEESILSCQIGEENVKKALIAYEEELKEGKKEKVDEKKETPETKPEQLQQINYTIYILLIIVLILIIIVSLFLYLMYRRYKKERAKSE